MAESNKKGHRQIERKNNRGRFRQFQEDQLLGIGYHGLTEEQIRLDAHQKNLTEWLNRT